MLPSLDSEHNSFLLTEGVRNVNLGDQLYIFDLCYLAQEEILSNVQLTSRLFSSPLLSLIPPSPLPLPVFAITSEKLSLVQVQKTTFLSTEFMTNHIQYTCCGGAIVFDQENLQQNLGLDSGFTVVYSVTSLSEK